MISEREPSRPDNAWRAILAGQPADHARRIVDEIAQALVRDWPPERLGPSLAGGCAGVALLFAYLDGLELGRGHMATAHRYLDAAVAGVRSERLTAALFGGFLGVAWTAEHLGDGARDRNGGIDAALLRLLSRGVWRRSYDLVNGLVGLGVYALERLPRPSGQDILALVIRRLDEMAERDEAGTCWPSYARHHPETLRSRYPERYHDIGVAHGVAGVLGFLGAADRAGWRSHTSQLVDETTSWLLAQWRRDASPAAFSPWVTPESDTPAARAAWCYGDPGVAAALLLAGRREATELALLAAARPAATAGVLDAGLCHGAAGLGLVFTRLAQATGLSAIRDAATGWLESTLAMAQTGRGIAGYPSWSTLGREGPHWTDDPGWLTGASGIALVLLAATSDIVPAWDRALLLSARSPEDWGSRSHL